MQVLRTPAEILREFLKGWDKLVADESAKSPFFKKVVDSQKAYAALVVPDEAGLLPAVLLPRQLLPPAEEVIGRRGLNGATSAAAPATASGRPLARRRGRPPGCCNRQAASRTWRNRHRLLLYDHQNDRQVHRLDRHHRVVAVGAAGRRGRLRGGRALPVQCADHLGVRRHLHAVRHRVHARRRLCAAQGRAHPHRLFLGEFSTRKKGRSTRSPTCCSSFRF